MPISMDNVEIIQPSTTGTLGIRSKDWELTDDDRSKMAAAFDEIMSEQLAKNGSFGLSDAKGDDVLVVHTILTQIAPNAPKDDFRSRNIGRGNVYTDGAGTISMAMTLSDGRTGEVLGIIKDTGGTQTTSWGVNNSVSNMGEVRRIMRQWGTRLQDGLTRLKSMSAMAQ
jgi:hypothetical protein